MSESNIISESLDTSNIKVSKPKEIPLANKDNVINSPGTKKSGGKKKSGTKTVKDNVLASSKVEKINKEEIPQKKTIEKVALHSTRNVYWDGLGEIKKGYNIVRKDRAEKWLTRDHVREATPEEVAKGFGKQWKY
jgi:hypothetical protein